MEINLRVYGATDRWDFVIVKHAKTGNSDDFSNDSLDH